MPRPQAPSSSYSKPTLETKFHIDYEWWQQSNQDLTLYMREHFCEEHRNQVPPEGIAHLEPDVDWIDPDTAVVTKTNSVMFFLLSHCSQQADYLSERTSLVDAVFRAFLMAGNCPMSPIELERRIGRPSEVILKTLSGRVVYNGLRPVANT